jgi:hypothetical protein
LEYLQKLKSGVGEFVGGVGTTLADRAKAAGGLAYEALTSDPNISRMNTAEFSEAAANRQTPRLDQAARDIGTIGKAILTQPVQTGKAIVRGEVDRAKEAMTSPQAAGQYAGSFIDPTRLAAALRHSAPIASKIGTGEGAQALEEIKPVTTAVEIPEALHGSPVRGLTELSPSKAMEVRGTTWFSDNADIADQYTFPREYGEILFDAEPGEVYKAGLSFKNPLTVDFGGKVGDAMELSKLAEQAKKKGYDGLIVQNVDDSIDSSKVLGTSYAVFDRNQIKLKK